MTNSEPSPQNPTNAHAASSGNGQSRRGPTRADPPSQVGEEVEEAVGITLDSLAAIFVLSGITGFGPQKFKELHRDGLTLIGIVSGGKSVPTKGKRGDALRSQLTTDIDRLRPICRERAVRQILAAHKLHARILTYAHPDYPCNVLNSNNPVPLLYVRGSLQSLRNSTAVACVGSRRIRQPY